ncbi:NADH-quinone oxidoreductase subunit NuoE [Candidatus Bipolaricaulota bacterium]|nr:NADH-quinone oxidoreductase subunit NuoE [Candidatus Bipolaricaulota bacterium]
MSNPTSQDSEEKTVGIDSFRTFTSSSASVIPLLQQIQNRYGYLSESNLERVSEYTHVPLSSIYGVATFYSQFRLSRPGKHLIRVCQGTACHVLGAGKIMAHFQEQLGIEENETTTDGLFTLESVRCLGCCSLAPAMMIDDETYGRLTRDTVDEILSSYREQEER